MRARGTRRQVVAMAGLLLAWSPCAFALNPALDVSQYAHTSWKIRDGFPKGMITSIAQTPDGYLWLGTEFGLFRFDGVRSRPLAAAVGSASPFQRDHELARRARRDSLDWHVERAGKLEGRQAHAVPGACRIGTSTGSSRIVKARYGPAV